MTIESWLENTSSNYTDGLALFQAQGSGGFVLKLLQKGESFYNRQRLEKELRALLQKRQPAPSAPPEEKPTPPEPAPAPFQERWHTGHTLSTDPYPEPLHPAVERLQKLYGFVNHYHPLLDKTYNQHRKEAFEIKCSLQDAWEEIEEIWRLLQYYQDNKVILPNRYNPEDKRLPRDRAELVKRRNNLRTYISRHKSNAKRDIDVREWQRELAIIDKELEDVAI